MEHQTCNEISISALLIILSGTQREASLVAQWIQEKSDKIFRETSCIALNSISLLKEVKIYPGGCACTFVTRIIVQVALIVI